MHILAILDRFCSVYYGHAIPPKGAVVSPIFIKIKTVTKVWGRVLGGGQLGVTV
jgi:hypothetical protein